MPRKTLYAMFVLLTKKCLILANNILVLMLNGTNLNYLIMSSFLSQNKSPGTEEKFKEIAEAYEVHHDIHPDNHLDKSS